LTLSSLRGGGPGKRWGVNKEEGEKRSEGEAMLLVQGPRKGNLWRRGGMSETNGGKKKLRMVSGGKRKGEATSQ